jgi:hypothetical protein
VGSAVDFGHVAELLGVDFLELTVRTFAISLIERSFAQRENGYTGTCDTYISEDQPSVNFGDELDLVPDLDSPTATGREKQALLRFEDIFGSSSSQVPPGVPIDVAFLELTTVNEGDGAAFHRMLEPWTVADTWSTFGPGGVVPGEEALSRPDAVVNGQSTTTMVNVSSSLRVWSSDPCSVFGWALISTGNDGWGVASSRGSNLPRLVVRYSPVAQIPVVEIGDVWEYLPGNEGCRRTGMPTVLFRMTCGRWEPLALGMVTATTPQCWMICQATI